MAIKLPSALLYGLFVTAVGGKILSFVNDCEQFIGQPFYAAPQLGYYGTYGGENGIAGPIAQPPIMPTPNQLLNFEGWYVMSNETKKSEEPFGDQYATAIIQPASGKNIMIGYNNSGIVSKMNLEFPPYCYGVCTNDEHHFNVTSTYAACFVDLEGGQAHGGTYYFDVKTAVDCLIKFIGTKRSTGAIVTQTHNYTGGCDLPGKGAKAGLNKCPQEGRPMQKVTLNSNFVDLTEFQTIIQSVYYKRPVAPADAGGSQYTGNREIMIALDDFAYNVSFTYK